MKSVKGFVYLYYKYFALVIGKVLFLKIPDPKMRTKMIYLLRYCVASKLISTINLIFCPLWSGDIKVNKQQTPAQNG